ncbi:hypothetical protein B0J12DRAFT_771660 [Macrophomina phaseolina]|uniref:Zn(2)-C6 fungal-type domain-containing protein n=1 Tax=Macrophomina phaseolina TaxID=35725 RepID=A0ABQ8FTN3_9PEZI|nr:hypothetical protein B0J12DRAFT_771660 [Macrophomina phaseolina]
MAAQRPARTAGQACLRCRAHKRKCDKLQPRCSLCKRLHQICEYEQSAPSASPSSEIDNALTPHGLKLSIVQRLSDLEPRAIASTYSRAILPWFAFISESNLHSRLRQTWSDASVDLTLLAFVIALFDESPRQSEQCCSFRPDTMSMYLSSKSWLALLEGAGLNSIDLVNARLLITLFEVVHGLYPAAYLSVASTIRAADALYVYGSQGSSLTRSSDLLDKREVENGAELWRGIMVLDRYLAVEHGKWPPVTRGRTVPRCRVAFDGRNPEPAFSPLHSAFEASSHLDHAHTAIHEPTPQQSFNAEEAELIVMTLNSFKTVLEQQTAGSSKLSSTGLVLANTHDADPGSGLLLILERGSRASGTDSERNRCRVESTAGLATLIEDMMKLFTGPEENTAAIDVQTTSPFTLYLTYKIAAIVTVRLQSGLDPESSLRRVRILRRTLKLMSRRWLAAERYLRLLDEDTTPRMLKLIEHDD